MAGMEGVEPSHTDPESAVLPLDDIPLFFWLGRKDSNPRMAGPKPAALPLGDCPAFFYNWRRGRDLNPGWTFNPHTLSRRAP